MQIAQGGTMNNILKLLLLFFFLLSSICFAEVKEITSEGTYNMGDGETPTIAESRALLQAKRIAVEQAGTYIESYSKVINLQLTHDEINVLASGIMEVTILDKKRTLVGDGVNFWVKIKAKVSTDKIEEMARKIREKLVVEDYSRLKKDYDKLAKEMELLKTQLKNAKSEEEKKSVISKIEDNEKLFTANEWLEKGGQLYSKGEYKGALEAINKAIALEPNHEKAWATHLNWRAYLIRGRINAEIGQLDSAIQDFNRVIEKYNFIYNGLEIYKSLFSRSDPITKFYYSAFLLRGEVYGVFPVRLRARFVAGRYDRLST